MDKGTANRGSLKVTIVKLRQIRSRETVVKIPSQLSSIKVNFVSYFFKVIIHLEAAGFFGGCLFSALRYSLVGRYFSVIVLLQGIAGIKALPVFHYSPDNMKHLSHTGNQRQLFAFAPVHKPFIELLYDRIYPCSYQCSHVKMVPYP